MKSVHEATHITEAHMFLHLLEQEGIEGHVEGGYLQGAVGELPAMGLVRVMVDNEDYEQASAFLKKWHAQQLELEEKTAFQKEKGSSFNWAYAGLFFTGAILGSILVEGYYSSPVTYERFDHNGDGVFEEKDSYKGSRIQFTEVDTNFDSKIDTIYFYDSEGRLDHYQGDHDFDGAFETTGKYKNNSVLSKEFDTDGNGFIDLRYKYINGSLKEIEFLDSDGKLIIKKQEYSPFKLESAQLDSDGDGIFDILYKYDDLEEIETQSPIKVPANPQ